MLLCPYMHWTPVFQPFVFLSSIFLISSSRYCSLSFCPYSFSYFVVKQFNFLLLIGCQPKAPAINEFQSSSASRFNSLLVRLPFIYIFLFSIIIVILLLFYFSSSFSF